MAIGGGELADSGVQVRLEVGPAYVGGRRICGMIETHDAGLPFVARAPGLLLADIRGGMAGDLKEPAAEGDVGRKPLGAAHQYDENGLRDIISEVRFADFAEGDGVDHIDVTPHEFAEGVGGAGALVVGEEFAIGHGASEVDMAGGGGVLQGK